MNRHEAETVALAVQSALNAADVIPAGAEVVVIVKGSGHVLVAGNGGPDSVGALIYAAAMSFLRAADDGKLDEAGHTVKPS